jgi:hypothetical protein
MSRNFGPPLWWRKTRSDYASGVHGTPAQVFAFARVTPLAGTVAGVCRTAVTTPVFAALRSPKTSCTPPVAPGVVTAVSLMNSCEPASGFLQ